MFSIGKRINLFRQAMGLNRENMAKNLGVSARTVQAWENEENSVPFEKVLNMIDMGANPSFMITGNGDILTRNSA